MLVPNGKKVFKFILDNGVVCDWREPDIIRIAPHPLYNTYVEIFEFVKVLKKAVES